MTTVKCVTCGTENEAAAMIKHDGNFCCVTEGCYMPLMEKESIKMSEFTMEGFNHISAEGVIEFWQLLQTQGTIDLLWDMQPKTKINALMQSENFDMDAHIKTNYCDHDGVVYNYDDICADMLDEMLETIITLEYSFIYDVYNIDFKGRSLKNLDSIPESTVWSPNVYLPITTPDYFICHTMDEVAAYCMDHFTQESDIGEATFLVNAYIDSEDSSDGQETQAFNYRVTGAGDCNILTELVDKLIEWGYTMTFTRIK